MFRKHKKKTEEDRNRSRSLGDILEGEVEERTVKMQKGKVDEAEWVEIASVSVVAPVVMCILPAYSADLVISAILAVGAIPLLTNGTAEREKERGGRDEERERMRKMVQERKGAMEGRERFCGIS